MNAVTFTVGTRILFTILVALMITGSPAAAQDSSDIDQRVERIVNGLRPVVVIPGDAPLKLSDRMNDLHVPGVSIAVMHGGAIEWARGFGVAAIGGPPIRPETLFQAGSISKPVAAVAALALVQAGKLDLDADVNLALKDWKIPANSFTSEAKVTLRRLLNHTAGTTVHGFAGYQAGKPVPSLVEVLEGKPPANSAPIVVDHEPGTRYEYSGGGYTIMQQLLIDVTGRPLPDLLQETVLTPFGMTHSHFQQPLPAEQVQLAATPYRTNGTAVPGGPHTYPELAAAGLWTTPSDLARFELALVDAWAGRHTAVLSQSTVAQMLTPGLGDDGLGLYIRGDAPNRQFSHGGTNAGFVGGMVAFENGDGAVIMTNGASGEMLVGEILRGIAAEYHWSRSRAKVKQRISVSPEALDRLVGTYELTPKFAIQVTREGNRLFAQATGQQRFEIFPETARDFFYTSIDAALSFDADGEARATQLILHQYGKDRPAKRVQ
jgi:CubicO group peptidase (beta-lactamase class C family)